MIAGQETKNLPDSQLNMGWDTQARGKMNQAKLTRHEEKATREALETKKAQVVCIHHVNKSNLVYV